jgi:hypothetical protein
MKNIKSNLKIATLNLPIFLKNRRRITNFAPSKKISDDKNYTSR